MLLVDPVDTLQADRSVDFPLQDLQRMLDAGLASARALHGEPGGCRMPAAA